MSHLLLPYDAMLNNFAEKLGFYSCRVYLRDNDYHSPLIYAYWRDAPVALSLRSGVASGVSVAFFRGTNPSSYGLPNSLLDQVYPKTTQSGENSKLSFKDFTALKFDSLELNTDSSKLESSFSDFIKTPDKDLAVNFSDDSISQDFRAYDNTLNVDHWDEVVDTNFADIETLLVISKALLEFYSNSREVIYQNIRYEN